MVIASYQGFRHRPGRHAAHAATGVMVCADAASRDFAGQAAVLTAVVAALRAFGNVAVAAASPQTAIAAGVFASLSLTDAVTRQGARLVTADGVIGERWPVVLRTDPFRELDRLTQQVLGTTARPAAMPMDAYRQGDTFYVHFDLPGVGAESIDLTAEQNVLTVRAERMPEQPDDAEMLIAERPSGMFTRQVFLGDTLDADNISSCSPARSNARH